MIKRKRELSNLATKAGAAEVVGMAITGGTHYVLRVKAPNGAVRRFFTAFTPSDRRANLNLLSDVRSWCRQNTGAPA